MDQPPESNTESASSRRSFIGMAGATLAAGAVSACSSLSTDTTPATPTTTEATSSTTTEAIGTVNNSSIHQLEASYPFRGEHQEGVASPAAPAGIVMGLDVTVQTRDELGALLESLSSEIELVMESADLAGEGISVVLGFGNSLFDDRFGLTGQKPAELQPMPVFLNDSLISQDTSHGDLSITINGASQQAVDQVLAQMVAVAGEGLAAPRWREVGHNTILPDAGVGEAPVRNLMGFKDGTVNLPTNNDEVMDGLVWIGEQDLGPQWAVGGTYQAVRIIEMLIGPWEETSVESQEAIVGRIKDSGAPIGSTVEVHDPYLFDLDFSSHIGRVNSRMGGINAILRRGFNYTRQDVDIAEAQQGLIFVSYQRSLLAGFIGMQQRLDGEALEQFVRPLHGGLFFVPPPPVEGDFLGQSLIES